MNPAVLLAVLAAACISLRWSLSTAGDLHPIIRGIAYATHAALAVGAIAIYWSTP